MNEHSLQCPKCKRTYDRSWRVCLFCSVPLKEYDERQDKDSGFDHFPGSASEIVAFTFILMMITPLLIALLYLGYLQALDLSFVKHKFNQLKQAIVFEEKEENKEEGKYYGN